MICARLNRRTSVAHLVGRTIVYDDEKIEVDVVMLRAEERHLDRRQRQHEQRHKRRHPGAQQSAHPAHVNDGLVTLSTS
jgi:hypothetical protein